MPRVSKLKSRKFQISLWAIIAAAVLPFIYRYCNVSDAIVQTVLGAIIALPTSYNLSNVWEKKKGIDE